MKINDIQTGLPDRVYSDTKTNIAALTASVGMFAYATDTKEIGYYASDGWHWADIKSVDDRLDRLFGADKPGHTNYYTTRPFYTDNYASNIAGFETDTSTLALSGTPPFSWAANPSGSTRSVVSSWLNMRVQGAAPLTLRWSSATQKNYLNMIINFAPSIKMSDYLAYEIRWWAVETPGASDNYWAFRIMWKPSASPQYPLYGKLYKGTGITYAEGDGIAVSGAFPIPMGTALYAQFAAYNDVTNPYGGFNIRSAEAPSSPSIGVVAYGYPYYAKCFDIGIQSGDWQMININDIWIT